MTTNELLKLEFNKHWTSLKDRDDTIFENINIALDPEARIFEMLENKNATYMEIVQENSLYEKKRIIESYFYENIVGDLYEETIAGLKSQDLLQETLDSFEKNYKLETTARLILERGVFSKFSKKKERDILVESVIEQGFYPATFYEKHRELINSQTLEESWFAPQIQWAGDTIRDIARVLKNTRLFLVYLLVTPVASIMAVPSMVGSKITGSQNMQNPSLRKFYSFMDDLMPTNIIFKFLNKDLYDIAHYLKKVNNIEDEHLQEVLREMKTDPNKTINKCWTKNKYQITASNPDHPKMLERMIHFLSGKGLSNMLRDPKLQNETQIALAIKSDASDPAYQRMFYDFRVCLYEKIFENIIGYSKAIYSMDDASYEIIRSANDAHNNKNFKAFFDLRPTQDNEEAMFKIMRALVAIDAIGETLDKRKAELSADKFIDKFTTFLRQNIKLVYQELNDMANQRKYNEDRYNDDNPDEEEKSKLIQQERFNAKKSIFDID